MHQCIGDKVMGWSKAKALQRDVMWKVRFGRMQGNIL